MNLVRTFLAFIVSAFLNLSVIGQTPVTGGIYSDAIWTNSGSPYIVSDVLTLFPNVTLTINPGVEIRFNQGAKFEVRGALIAEGNAMDSISFVSNLFPSQNEDWLRVEVRRDLGAYCSFNYCKFRNAHRAVAVESSPSFDEFFSLKNCLFEGNRVGFYGGPHPSNQSDFLIDSCYFKKNLKGIGDHGGTSEFVVTNTQFENNTHGVDYISDVTLQNCSFCGNIRGLTIYSDVNVQNCTFTNNRVAIWPVNNDRESTFENCIIAENDTGLVLHSIINRPYSVNQNKICNNRFYNVIQFGDYNEDLSNNCWCTNDSLEILAGNFDGYDDVNYGLIQFGPVWNCDTTFLENLPQCSSLVGIDEATELEDSYLSQCFPNPCSVSTSIEFILPRSSKTSLGIYDLNGHLVLNLIENETLRAGKHHLNIDVESLPSGLFYYLLSGDSYWVAKKIIVLR